MNWRSLILSAVAVVACTASPVMAGPVIRHHDLSLLLQPEEGVIEGVSTLTIAAGNATVLRLQMAPQVHIVSVLLEGNSADYEWHGGVLSVPVPKVILRKEATLAIAYRGSFRDPVPENPVHSEDPTYGVAATIGPRGTFLASGAGWYPEIPGSRSTFRLRLEAPEGTEGVTSGRRIDHGIRDSRSFSVWETDKPLTGLTLVAGPYQIRESQAGGIPLYTYFYPGTGNLADTYLSAAKNYLELYVGLFGPYPFEKFAVVENFFPTGYGFPSWTLLGSTVVRLPFIVETSLGHEIAHSWWGTGVRVDYARGNWSEGLTTYVADHLYKERLAEAEGREYRLKILRDYAALVPTEKDFALRQFAARRSAAEQAVGYGKAAMVFHMVRREIGDQAFWPGLRTLATQKMGQVASWDDFADQLGKVANKDLRGFFRQWVSRPGAPALRLTGVTATPRGSHWQVNGVLVQDGQLYDLQVPLRLESAEGEIDTVLTVTGRESRFSMEAQGRPRRLTVDPEVDLFRRLEPTEIPPTVNAIRGSTMLTVVTAADLPAELLAASRILLAALRQEGATIRSEVETDPADLQGRDVLFVGIPRRSDLLPLLPAGLELVPDGFSVQGQTFSGHGATLFTTLPRPEEPERSAALLLSFSPGAAEVAVRKIPHYGKFSYLVFDNGTNQAKGTWPPTASSMVHDFADD